MMVRSPVQDWIREINISALGSRRAEMGRKEAQVQTKLTCVVGESNSTCWLLVVA